jgi:hypothetical protein
VAERDQQAGEEDEIERKEVMVSLTALWIPILLSAVLVFVVSSIIHMASPWHKNDYPRIPNEDAVRSALRPLNIPPGSYMVPRPASPKEMGSPEFAEKMKTGPVLMLQVMPNGMTPMTKNLINWFIYLIVIGVFAAYLTSRAVGPGTNYLTVFRFVGTTAFMGFALALWQMTIWYRRSWVITMKSTIDGLIYACLMGGVFGWLWPR